jgi:carboxyl-terminal processing protease
LLIGVAFGPAFPSRAASAEIGAPAAAAAQENIVVFDEAWRLVRDRFYDPKLHGVDWAALGDRYRPQAAAAQSPAELSHVINALLAELGASHTAHYTPAETAYYELLDIFSRTLRRDIRRLFPGGEVAYTGIGVVTRPEPDGALVTGLLAGSPADRAGVQVGDRILTADGEPFQPVASFADKTGKRVKLSFLRRGSAQPAEVTVTPSRIPPDRAFFDAMEASARLIPAKGLKIGYVRIWSYASPEYQELLEEMLSTGKLKDADALIWDLRGGWGGAQPSYLSLFDDDGPTLTRIDRDGSRHVSNFRWRKPIVLLVDEGTRSGKEVLAYGFKAQERGEVVGERTAGAVLAARAFLLRDDSLLLIAVSDVEVDGVRLEGIGVTPTVPVPFDPATAAGGADPQLEKAVEILSQPAGG